ncbi:MAG: hypothetical protein COA74_04530 [Gammaproteobacteria bacterium]|nr:MAG: hypothetical protein COA74_04530 [Gammaproteobacteria bacterium]
MLSCKQFVESVTDVEEYESASVGQKFQIKLHLFMCQHCKTYSNQFRITTEVAKKLSPEGASETVIEQSIRKIQND